MLGLPSQAVKVSPGLQADFTGRVTLSPGSTLQALLTRFVMGDILCNGPKFALILELYGKHVGKKRENIIIVDRI